MRPGTRRARGDGGAAAVEFALLFPIFMILALGIIFGGMAFSKQINVTQAAREASRYGATDPVGTTPAQRAAWLQRVYSAAIAAAGNPLDPLGGYDYICVAYVETDSAGAVVGATTRLESDAGMPVVGQDCPTNQPRVKNGVYVQTTIARSSNLFVLFINPTIQVDSVSVTPYERRA